MIQRVPVKIFFDEPLPADHVLGPGLSVTPSVEVGTFVFPAWAIALLAIIIAGASALVFVFVTSRKANG